jgi:hypothetical protein
MAVNFAQVPQRSAPSVRSRPVLRPCGIGGCRKPRVTGEKTCFDHIDVAELERAIEEPDVDDEPEQIHPQREEVAPAYVADAEKEMSEMPKKAEKFLCKQGCGRALTSEGRRVQHEMHCKGKPATSGRIAAREAAAAPAKKRTRHKRARPVSRPQVRSQKRKRSKGQAHRTPPPAAAVVVGASCESCSHQAMCGLRPQLEAAAHKALEGLKRTKITATPQIVVSCSSFAPAAAE